MRQLGIGLLVIVAVALLAWLYGNRLVLTKMVVTVDGLPAELDGLRIVQLSDLHGATFGADNERLAGLIGGAKPDVIICSGDMLNNRGEQGFFTLLRTLAGKYPVYVSLGNHDQVADQSLLRQLGKLGAIVLDNERVAFRHNGAELVIAGLTARLEHYRRADCPTGQSALTRDYITKVIGPAPTGRSTLLIAHDPKWFAAYADWGADVVLAGHVHGGLVRIPGLGGLLSPDGTFFPKYDGGLYSEGASAMVVSRGLAGSPGLVRILNPFEVGLITLTRPTGSGGK